MFAFTTSSFVKAFGTTASLSTSSMLNRSVFTSTTKSLSSSSSHHFSNSSSFSRASVCCLLPHNFTSHRFAARATYSEITTALNVLSCKIDDTKDAKLLKKKYLDLVRKNHPDRGGSEDKMKDITTAYDLLSGLSDFDKKEYNTKARYSGGSSNAARNAAYQQRAQQTQSAYDFQDMYRQQYEGGGNMNRGSGSNYGTYQGQTQTNDPYGHWRGGSHTGSGESTGNFSRTMYNARRTPTSIIFFRALVIYSIVVLIVVLAQRASDDYTNQSGWQAASKQARQDRLEQIFESRQEFIDKLRDRDMRMRMEKEKQKEKRMYDYAAQRQAEMNRMEFGSFPPLPTDGRLGSIFKVPADPVGILYYEPPMKNSFESSMLKKDISVSGNMVNGGVSQKQQLDPSYQYNNGKPQPAPSPADILANTANNATLQPIYPRSQNYDSGKANPAGFSSGNFTLTSGSSSKQEQREMLMKKEAAAQQQQASSNNTQQQQQQPMMMKKRREPRGNDSSDYDPELDSLGHGGMVAKPVAVSQKA